MAVKRRLPAGSQSTTSSGEVTPVTSIATALEDSAELWNAENELKLLQALMTHKPTGIAKNFQMALLLNKISEGGLKSVTGQQVFDHLEDFFNLKAFDTLQNTLTPLVLQSVSAGGGQSLVPLRCDATNLENSHAEFQLPLKGFYRHFKEMTETSGVTVEDAEIYFPQETPKASGIKRPTRSTPSSGSNAPPSKRRK